ncbi:hypothetical protein ACSVDA_00900 [Cytobacillus sp. Hm23]
MNILRAFGIFIFFIFVILYIIIRLGMESSTLFQIVTDILLSVAVLLTVMSMFLKARKK